MTPSEPSVDTLGTLTVNAVSASGGQTVTVSPKATGGIPIDTSLLRREANPLLITEPFVQ